MIPNQIDLVFTPEEDARIADLVNAYRALPGASYLGASEDSILRMILEGGVFQNQNQSVASALAEPNPLRTRAIVASDSTAQALDELGRRWALSLRDVLRIVVVDGLAYVEEALDAFQRGHKFVPSKGIA